MAAFPTLPTAVKTSLAFEFANGVQSVASGKELRVRRRSVPRRRWTLEFSGISGTDAATFVNFILARTGNFEAFDFVCPYDGVTRASRIDGDSVELSRVVTGVWSGELEILEVL
jgi:hypothetical protein